MASVSSNVFSQEDLQYINQLPEVIAAKAKITDTSSTMVYFTIQVTETIRSALQSRFGLDLSSISTIPMRWIQGDIAPHIDSGASAFENTYLVYLNASAGNFVIDDAEYPITENTGFVFSEGVSHKTQGTGNTPRLLVGPMNEFAEPVGGPLIFYYTNYNDAVSRNTPNRIAESGLILGNLNAGSIGSYTAWRVARISSNSSIPTGVYTNGYDLSQIEIASYDVYPAFPCFLEGTQVLTQIEGNDTYLPIETLTPGTLVKTSRDGYKKVVLVGKGVLHNPGNADRIQDRLYKCSPSQYPTLTSDLYLTGGHSILVDRLTHSQQHDTIKQLGDLFVTDGKYRLLAQLDERAEPWGSEQCYTIWHVALENENIKSNYGIYVNGGLLVESSSINFLQNKSNMCL
jgi:hypothetical protein